MLHLVAQNKKGDWGDKIREIFPDVILPDEDTEDEYVLFDEEEMARINQTTAEIYEEKAAEVTEDALRIDKRGDELEEKAELYEKQLKKFFHKKRFYKRTIPHHLLTGAAIGFILGFIIAVTMILEEHGPTVTVGGTLGACAIYVLAGIVGAAVFGFLGWLQAISMIDWYEHKIADTKEAIKVAKAERQLCINEADRLATFAIENRREALRYRNMSMV